MKILRCDRVHPNIECFCSRPHHVNDEIKRIIGLWLDDNEHCSPCCGVAIQEVYDAINEFINGEACSGLGKNNGK